MPASSSPSQFLSCPPRVPSPVLVLSLALLAACAPDWDLDWKHGSSGGSACERDEALGLWIECADMPLVVQQACPAHQARGLQLRDDGSFVGVRAVGPGFAEGDGYCELSGEAQSGSWEYEDGAVVLRYADGRQEQRHHACVIERLGVAGEPGARAQLSQEGLAGLPLAPSEGTSTGECRPPAAECDDAAQCASGICDESACVDALALCGSAASDEPCACGMDRCEPRDDAVRCCTAEARCGVQTPFGCQAP